MTTTSVTLLERLKKPDDQAAWERFADLYTPLLLCWARRAGLTEADAADHVQDVLLLLLDKLPAFAYDQRQNFRGWLRTVALNKLREQLRRRKVTAAGGDVDQLHDVAVPDGLEQYWDTEYHQHLVACALNIMQSEFESTTWRACWEHTVSGRSAAEVGRELGLSEGAVYVAKSRVLRRLRHELAGLL